MIQTSIVEAQVHDIHRLYRERRLTPLQLVNFYLARVDELDLKTDAGPPFNCIICISPSVRDDATTLTGEILRDGVVKPRGDFDEQTVPMELLAIDPGTLVVFNDRLLHGGAVNAGSTTRVSAEFTMFVPRHYLLSRGCMPEQLDGRLIVSGAQSSTAKVT